MAGLTITVGAVDITAYVDVQSIEIEQVGTSGVVAICRFLVRDHTGTVSIASKATIDIDDDGLTLFGGLVAHRRCDQEGVARLWTLQGQDYNILLNETAVPEEEYSGKSDAYILNHLFTTYRSDINATTYVSTIDADMGDIAFNGQTLAEVMQEICNRTGGRWYVDYDKNLHYFATESNPCAWNLSDSPNGSTTFGYSEFNRDVDDSELVNRFYIVGKEINGWAVDAASVATYGEREAVYLDQKIATSQHLTDVGTALLDRYAQPKDTITLCTLKAGLVAGMSIDVTNSLEGLTAATYYVRKLTTTFVSTDADSVRRHHLELGDEPLQAVGRVSKQNYTIKQVQRGINEIGDSIFDTDAPATPTFTAGNLSTGVDITPDGTQMVYLQATWGAVGDADLSRYEVQISTSSDFSGYTITRAHPADGDRLERFVGLLGNTNYYARVRAVDWVDNASAWSSTQTKLTAKDSTAPGQVTGLSVAASRTLMGLSWTHNTDEDLSHYDIARAPDVGGSPGTWTVIAKAKLNFYIDQDFTDGEIAAQDTFHYKVRAVDTSGNLGTYSSVVYDALSQITGDHIAALTITAGHIAANTITADKMNVSQLSAISANLGTVTAGTITTCTIRTAASGQRVQIDSTNGLQAYNSVPEQTVSIQTTGAGWLGASDAIWWNSAGTLSIDGGLVVDGTIVATAITNTLGQPLFLSAGGTALWGVGCQIDPTAPVWYSTRHQGIYMSGAMEMVTGRWPGSIALKIQSSTTNYCLNPRMIDADSSNKADGYLFLDPGATFSILTHPRRDYGWLQRMQYTGEEYEEYETVAIIARTEAGTFAAGNTAWAQVQVKGTLVGCDFRLYLRALNSSDTVLGSVYVDPVLTRDLQTYHIKYPSLPSTTSKVQFEVGTSATVGDGDTVDLYVGAIQIEKSSYFRSNFTAGNLGKGYQWTGTEDASKSTRSAMYYSHGAADMLDETEGSISMWVQMPCDAGAGSYNNPGLWCWWDSWNTNSMYIGVSSSWAYLQFIVYDGGVGQSVYVSFTGYQEGDWVHLAFTWKDPGELRAYRDGVLVDHDDVYSAPSISNNTVYVGHAAASGYAAFGELAYWSEELTAGEVATIFFEGPLVDPGAMDISGIYLYNGRFRLASCADGARTEIDTDGIKAYTNTGQSVSIQPDGDVRFGSDISAAATTAFALFATGQEYNGETMGAGDILMGDNSSSKANLLWDKSDGLLRFRGGTTTQVYISTDGSLMAGGGAIKISAAANVLFSVASANQGLSWFTSTTYVTNVGFIQVATSTYAMTLATGGSLVSGWKDFYIKNQSSSGTDRTPFYIAASNKRIGMYQTSPSGTLHVHQNDASGAIPVLVLEQEDTDQPYIQFLDATIYTGKTEANEYIKISLGGATRYLRAYS